MQGNVTILVTWANAMQASGGYRCAEAVGWWLCVQQGNGCRVPAGAIDALRLCAGALWVQHGNGCRPAGLGTDAGQLVLLGC